MKFERTLTSNWGNAFHGLRHPMESYHRSDSSFGIGNWYDMDAARQELKEPSQFYFSHNGIIREGGEAFEWAFIGENDMNLAQRMIAAGTPNDKFLRQIFVSVDITAPLYW